MSYTTLYYGQISKIPMQLRFRLEHFSEKYVSIKNEPNTEKCKVDFCYLAIQKFITSILGMEF